MNMEPKAKIIKCLIWDLDNTLWEGTLRENWDVIFGEHKRDLIVQLDKAGILQSIASRNDYDIVMKKLDELGLREYFLYPQCNFGSKVDSIKRIVKSLNIGMDSVGFIDDDAFELFEIDCFLPELHTYRADELDRLMGYDEFNIKSITKESASRRKMMISRQQREEKEKTSVGTREDFLRECRMEITIRQARVEDIDRIHELAVRTNQLNSIGQAIDIQLVREYIENENKLLFVTELTDRFGYHGLVGVCFLEIKNDIAFIKLFCISCRIEGRGIGVAFLSEVMQLIEKDTKIREVRCIYKSSSRNLPALMLLKILGFQMAEKGNDSSIYLLKLPHQIDETEWLSVKIENS